MPLKSGAQAFQKYNLDSRYEELDMKKTITITIATLGVSLLGMSPAALAGDSNGSIITSSFSTQDSDAAKNLRHCFSSDVETASSRAIRACSKAYKDSIPNYDIRSDILMRRGLLKLSAGRFEKASRDFKSAAKLNKVNEFAYLGQGYAALMQNDYKTAQILFEDCLSNGDAAPLAVYGLAMVQELSGDKLAAVKTYEKAAALRPDWTAPRDELLRIKSSL